MVRGMIVVTCPHCGKTFVAPDIEWAASALSAPVTCPHCRRTVNPNGHKGLWGIILRWISKKNIAPRVFKSC